MQAVNFVTESSHWLPLTCIIFKCLPLQIHDHLNQSCNNKLLYYKELQFTRSSAAYKRKSRFDRLHCEADGRADLTKKT
ncbi:hypothetical protein T07_10529 [Trichinella nelsoni]|uniref:Uncharacterized protein n=1 Tax=Trichinella nelsoni TaxID=6336 RepID=A0A0V0S7W6_9BILA|nr:hypothetical protein T07_10529 [Trichinella nelsoni]